MKKLFYFIIILSLSLNSFAQNSTQEIENFYKAVYSLKTKGIRDFVVDIKNNQLKDRLNNQKIFGKVDEVFFRLYWTAKPERLALEVLGLPDGFRELKDLLKSELTPYLEELVPMSFGEKFKDYDVKALEGSYLFELNDKTGLNAVPKFVFKFDNQKILSHILGKKPVGEINYNLSYEKRSFSQDKYVLVKSVTESKEAGVNIYIEKNFSYATLDGTGVLKRLEVESKTNVPGDKPTEIKSEESFDFKNYKINTGEALNYFLGENSKK